MITRRLMMAASLAALAAACSPEPKAAKGRGKAIRFATDWRAQGEHGGFTRLWPRASTPNAGWT